MSKPTTHYGSHRGRTLKASSFIADMLSYPDDLPLEFTVQPARIRKTPNQNDFLHVTFTIAARKMNEAGFGNGVPWTMQRVKDYCKQAELYPTYEIQTPKGIVTMSMDTHELSKEETALTIDRVMRHFAEEFNIYLPQPNEQIEMPLS